MSPTFLLTRWSSPRKPRTPRARRDPARRQSRSPVRRVPAALRVLLPALLPMGFMPVSPALATPPSNTLSIVAGNGSVGAATPGPATGTSLIRPTGVNADAAGNLYVADNFNAAVYKITPSGTLSYLTGTGTRGTPTPGPASTSQLHYPAAVATDAAGNVYVADDVNPSVVKVTPGGVLSIVAGTGNGGTPVPGPATSSPLGSARGVAVDSAGNVYIADTLAAVVEKVTPAGTLSIVAGTGGSGTPLPGPASSSPLTGPTGVALDVADNLYIADADASVVARVTPGGVLSIVAGTGTYGAPTPGPATSSDLGKPTSVAVDASGNAYVADPDNRVVEQIGPGGVLSIIAGTGNGGAPAPGPALSSPLPAPYGVAVDASGNVYIADASASVVAYVVPPASPEILTPPSLTLTTTLDGYDRQIPTAHAVRIDNYNGNGWNLTITADTAPATATTPRRTLPAQIITADPASTAADTTTPTAVCAIAGCTLPNPGTGTNYPVTVTTSGTSTLYSAGPGSGIRAISLPLQVWTTIPATAGPGTYTSTLTLSVNYGP